MSNTRTYDCTDPADQSAIAQNHEISEATFNEYISNFWGSNNPTPTTKTWAQMETLMSGHDCSQKRLRFQADENSLLNNEVNIAVEPVPTTEIIKNYSFALFNGVKVLHNDVAEFQFFKAKKDENTPDIIFRAVTATNQVLFCGDLSDLYP